MFFKSEKINNQEEIAERPVLEKLNELGIKYKYEINKGGQVIYTFINVREAGGGAFYLDAGDKQVVYYNFHFNIDNGVFKHPNTKVEVLPDELLSQTKEQFGNADEIIYSCCAPNEASIRFSNAPIIIGSGLSEYKTVYNNRNRSLVISPVNE